jgi:hypothetical protein
MQRSILITVMIATISHFQCISWTLSIKNINRELTDTAESLKKDRSLVYKLDQKKVGATGYFYIMKTDGRISYHPKKGLINFSFSEYAFAKKIIKNKNGCLVSTADSRTRYIFYNDIGGGEILCLTIDSSEIDENAFSCESTGI